MTSSIKLSAQCARTAFTYNEEHSTCVMATLTGVAPPAENESVRPSLDICLLLDRSGSMEAESKLELCKETISMLSKEMTSVDSLSIVSYDTKVEETVSWTRMNSQGKSMVEKAMNGVKPGSCTNLSGAILNGIELLKNGRTTRNPFKPVNSWLESTGLKTKKFDNEQPPQGSKKILMILTDGLANVGIQNPEALISCVIQNLGELRDSVQIFTFGYGSDHDSSLLRSLSETTNVGGGYFYIENPDQISSAFSDCLGGLMSTVAQAVRLSIESVGGAQFIGEPLTKFKYKTIPSGFEIDIPDVYEEECRSVLAEFRLPKLTSSVAELGDAAVARISVSYVNCVSGASESDQVVLCVSRPETMNPNEIASAENIEVEDQRLRHDVAATIEVARKNADQDDFASGQQSLGYIAERIDKMRLREGQSEKQRAHLGNLERDVQKSISACQNKHDWASKGRSYMNSVECEHYYQRPSANMCEGSSNYRTGSQSKMAKAFKTKSSPS